MRINLHDYSAHPFQLQLARELARRGHVIEHTYSSQYPTGHGRLTRRPDDPDGFSTTPLTAAVPFEKYQPAQRIRFEASYARAWRRYLDDRAFDLVVSSNVPLVSLALMQRYLRRRRLPWVFWHQDIYSKGIGSEVARVLPFGSELGARRIEDVEARLVRNASRVIAIGDAFVDQYRRWGVSASHASVIPNWAPLDEIAPTERDNRWSREQGLPAAALRLIYSGTLGRKHNPRLLLQVLDQVRSSGIDANLIVCSEGVGADDLREVAGDRSDVSILGFQPAEVFAEVLGSGDLMIALLEPDASRFSIPSKVLTYLAAGRPIIGLMPADNPAAHDIAAAGGFVAGPNDDGAAAASAWIVDHAGEPNFFENLSADARRFAANRFDIRAIADQFESVFAEAAAPDAA